MGTELTMNYAERLDSGPDEFSEAKQRRRPGPRPKRPEQVKERLIQRFDELLGSVGLTGREIAKISGTKPQYISDIKRRQRPLSEDMFMRTLHGLFGDYGWLMTKDLEVDSRNLMRFYPHIAANNDRVKSLPVLREPFVGPVMAKGEWNGEVMDLTPPAATRAQAVTKPYILRLSFDSLGGRLRRGDLLLVGQGDRPEARLVLLKTGWAMKLAKRVDSGFEDVDSGERIDDPEVRVIASVELLLMGEVEPN